MLKQGLCSNDTAAFGLVEDLIPISSEFDTKNLPNPNFRKLSFRQKLNVFEFEFLYFEALELSFR